LIATNCKKQTASKTIQGSNGLSQIFDSNNRFAGNKVTEDNNV
jgi:hypothetical protein